MGLMGKKIEVVEEAQRVRPEKSEVLKLICDNRKIKEQCAWSPRTSMKNGLKETIDFVEKNMNLFKPEIYNV